MTLPVWVGHSRPTLLTLVSSSTLQVADGRNTGYLRFLAFVGQECPTHTDPGNIHSSQTGGARFWETSGMTTKTLATALEGFLSGSSGAVVIEDGAVMFCLEHAKYSVSGESNKCLLHLWSEEWNVVRRVLDVESKGESLRVTVQRMGQVRPTKLEICRERDARTISARRKGRAAYQQGVRASRSRAVFLYRSIGRGGARCGRRLTTLRGGWFGRLPMEFSRTGRSWDC